MVSAVFIGRCRDGSCEAESGAAGKELYGLGVQPSLAARDAKVYLTVRLVRV